ncbi:hypothetical protein [Moorena producens]|uniref:hypothetical protein n=1 Tax=Moorena producens TaxID=1155739 RepID=UPI0011EA67E8|nr:hypothetical protein [Moorena producens]
MCLSPLALIAFFELPLTFASKLSGILCKSQGKGIFPLLYNPMYCTQVQTVIIDSAGSGKSLSDIHLAIDQAAFHRSILSAEC